VRHSIYTRAGARGCVCAAYIHTRCLGMHDHFTLHEKQAEAGGRFASTASLLRNPRAIEEGAIAEGFLIGRLSIDSRQSRVRDKLARFLERSRGIIARQSSPRFRVSRNVAGAEGETSGRKASVRARTCVERTFTALVHVSPEPITDLINTIAAVNSPDERVPAESLHRLLRVLPLSVIDRGTRVNPRAMRSA